jgi:hypothetical protein
MTLHANAVVDRIQSKCSCNSAIFLKCGKMQFETIYLRVPEFCVHISRSTRTSSLTLTRENQHTARLETIQRFMPELIRRSPPL